ncbi:hypothetical protein JCM8547_007073 [Rhodosporidiobolus lusitaniae]
MRSSLSALLALAPLAALAASPHSSSRGAHKKRAGSYSLTSDFSGDNFFNAFSFVRLLFLLAPSPDRLLLPPPAHSLDTTNSNGGIANYVDEATAWAEDLVAIKNGKAHIRVHPKSNGDSLDAVKLTTKEQYSEGLYIWDIERMPQVCGAWPAIWSSGDNWPANGELDLVEYVSHQSMDSMSVHTATGCWAGSTGYTGTQMLEGTDGLNCDADATSSQGCGFRTASNNTAGIGSNFDKAGVYALEWASSGIKAWFFPRDSIPSDIESKNPDPSSWDTPTMYISADACAPLSNYFGPQTWVINTQLCGTWPSGTVWSSDNSYAGQEGSCQEDTGYATCEEYVLNEAQDFKHAYWRIGYFRVFNK